MRERRKTFVITKWNQNGNAEILPERSEMRDNFFFPDFRTANDGADDSIKIFLLVYLFSYYQFCQFSHHKYNSVISYRQR